MTLASPFRTTKHRVAMIGSLVATLLVATLLSAPAALAERVTSDVGLENVPATAIPVVVPATIDPTGTFDVTAEITDFIRNAPDGSTIRFQPDASYKINGSVIIQNRTDLTIDGAGATFFATNNGAWASTGRDHGWWGRRWPKKRSQFIFDGGSGHRLGNLTIQGGNPNGGMDDDAYVPDLEAQHGVIFWGTVNAMLDRCTITDTYGDLVYVGGDAREIVIRDCKLARSGRQGIAVTWARDVVIADNIINNIRRSVLDLEPASPAWAVDGVVFRDNTIGNARLSFIASLGSGLVNNVRITGNHLRNQELKVRVASRLDRSGRRHGWVIADNVSERPWGSPIAAITFDDVDDVVITGNVQPVKDGRDGGAVTLRGATTASVRDNDFPLLDKKNRTTGRDADVVINGNAFAQPILVPVSDAGANG